MKNNLIILSLSLLVFIFSCSEKDMEYSNVDFDSETFVAFTNEQLSVNELVNNPIEVEALYAASRSSAMNISVPFTISGDAVEGVDYTIVDNKSSYNFSPDQLSDSIFIMPIDNSESDGDKEIVITLNSNGVYLGYPGPDNNNKTITMTIVDDDCPYTLEELGAASWSGSDNAGGSEGPNDSQITTSYDVSSSTFTMEGIAYGWLTNTNYWDEVVVDSYPVVVDFNTTTGELTIATQPLCNTTWVGAPQPAYSIQATGTYESCSETMTINWDLIQGGGILRSYTETITKN